jgi:hypothetical protein
MLRAAGRSSQAKANGGLTPDAPFADSCGGSPTVAVPANPTMPKIRQSAKIAVNAAVEDVFDLVAADLIAVDDDPDAMVGHRPLDEGPLREGFRWQQRIVHNRHVCGTEWRVTEVARPRVLEQTMAHFCADAQREVHGGERWEFWSDDGGSTLVDLRSWRIYRGVGGWIDKLFREGPTSAAAISLKKRLAYVQFEAERRSRDEA